MKIRRPAAQSATRVQILNSAITRFAYAGYRGVSMRDVAAAVGISAAALYHHFPDKQALYLAAMEYAFARNEEGIVTMLKSDLPPLERLAIFVERFTVLVARDEEFGKLVQRELLDGDAVRMELLNEKVFRKPREAIVALARELVTDLDPYLFADSLIGMVLSNYQFAPLRRTVHDEVAAADRAKAIARHITALITRAVSRPDSSV